MEGRLKRKEIREKLNVTRYGYETLIADGILDEPIRKPGRHPFHTASQLKRAEDKLREIGKTVRRTRAAGRRSRPLSQKMRDEVISNYAN